MSSSGKTLDIARGRDCIIPSDRGVIDVVRFQWYERSLHATAAGLVVAAVDFVCLFTPLIMTIAIIRLWYFGNASGSDRLIGSPVSLVVLIAFFPVLLAFTGVLVATSFFRENPMFMLWILNAPSRLLGRRPAFSPAPSYTEKLERYIQRECIDCGYSLDGAVQNEPKQPMIICPECGSQNSRLGDDSRIVLAVRKSPAGTPWHGLRWRLRGLLTAFGGQLIFSILLHLTMRMDELMSLEWILGAAVSLVLVAMVLVDVVIKRNESSENLDPPQQWLLESARCPRCAADLLCGADTEDGLRRCAKCASLWKPLAQWDEILR